jgi:3-dehydroquinate dehydratase/shikimate dehydrogenase
LGFPNASELGKAAERECKDGTTFFEFRLDYLTNPNSGVELIRRFRQAHPETHILATCRHRRAHGHFSGTAEMQIAILNASAEAGASFVDLEIETAEIAKGSLLALRDRSLLIVSYHNFQNTPALDGILRRLKRVPADVYKIATTARKPTDNLRLIQFTRQHDDSALVLLAMSEVGASSRILAPALGSIFTYAAPSEHAGTAPGQIPAKVLRSLYREEKLTKYSRVFGVIADPVSHSKSPFIHNRAFQARRVDAVYLPFLVSQNNLGDWMSFASKLPVAGFSVTIPHKRRILRYLDTVEPLARRIGAVNTVWRKAGKWRGTNTDTEGILKPLSKKVRLPNSSVLIAGYGGAARAAAVALHDAGARVTITGRNPALAQSLSRVVKGESITLKQAQNRHFDVLIHATPLGMLPNTNECVFPEEIPADLVFDMVYNPAETLLLKRAKAQGCAVIPGTEMLLAQAVSQFEIWTGETGPQDVMRAALESHL